MQLQDCAGQTFRLEQLIQVQENRLDQIIQVQEKPHLNGALNKNCEGTENK